MKQRAVTYARTSGDDRGKDNRNLKGQTDLCREYALKRGYIVVAELAEDDRGVSGASFDLPQLGRVLEMAQAGEFDVLVVREIDRLSRKLAKQLVVEQQLRQAGVTIEYVLGEYPNTPEGDLNKHVRAAIAEYEREKINERMMRAKRLKVKSGSVMTHGKAPYGYDLVKQNGQWAFEINEKEARVVRLIFEWYTVGDGEDGPLSMYQIATRITELGHATQGDKGIVPKVQEQGVWTVGTIAYMLKNQTYVGTWHYGKTKRISKGKRINVPRDKWIPVAVPVIVSDEAWRMAQENLERNRELARRNTKRDYLLRRRVVCGECGMKVSGCHHRRNSYYKCPAANRGKSVAVAGLIPCSLPSFRAELVDAAVWDWLSAVLMDPERLKEGLEEYQREQNNLNAPLYSRLEAIESLLHENQSQLDRLLDLYLTGGFSKEMLLDKEKNLREVITALEREQTQVKSQLHICELTPGRIRNIEEYAQEIQKGMVLAENDYDTIRQILDLLNITVVLKREDEQMVVYIRGVIGNEKVCIASKASTDPTAKHTPSRSC